MSANAVYLDSSALVKLVVREAESVVLRRHLRRSALLPIGADAMQAGRDVLARCDLVRLNDRVLGDDLAEIVTYDDRMADAARRAGHRVTSPG